MQDFDFQKFLARTRLKQREVAAKTGVSLGLVGMWASGRSKPSYDTIVKLIRCGMTCEELFGSEISKLLFENSKKTEIPMNKEAFIAGVREAMAAIAKSG